MQHNQSNTILFYIIYAILPYFNSGFFRNRARWWGSIPRLIRLNITGTKEKRGNIRDKNKNNIIRRVSIHK